MIVGLRVVLLLVRCLGCNLAGSLVLLFGLCAGLHLGFHWCWVAFWRFGVAVGAAPGYCADCRCACLGVVYRVASVVVV